MGNIGGFQIGMAEAQKSSVRALTEKNIKKLLTKGILKNQKECDELLAAYLSGDISFGVNGLSNEELDKFDRNNYNIIQNSYKQYKQGNKKPNRTLYIVQVGDNPQIIAENLIDIKTPDREKKVKELAYKIQADAQRQGLWYSCGLKIGDVISIQGNYTEQIKKMEKFGIYYSKTESINKNYDDIYSGQKEKRKYLYELEKALEEQKLQAQIKIQTPEQIAGYKKLGKKLVYEIETRRDLHKFNKKSRTFNDIPAPIVRQGILNKHITKENAAFLMLQFAESKKQSMIDYLALTYDNKGKLLTQYDLDMDRISSKPKYNSKTTKKLVSMELKQVMLNTLLARAEELNVKGINYEKIWDIDDADTFAKYIDDIAVKVARAEVRKSPKIKKQVNLNAFEGFKIAKSDIQQSNIQNLKNSGKALALAFNCTINNIPVVSKLKEKGFWGYFGNEKEILESVTGNRGSRKTKELYKYVNSENVAFLINEYKALGKNGGLVGDLSGESGISIDEIKENICKPLQKQADKYGIKINLVYDWKNSNNAYWVNRWANETARAIQHEIYMREKPNYKRTEAKKGITLTHATKEDAKITSGMTKKTIPLTEEQKKEGITKAEEYYDESGTKLYTLFYGLDKNNSEVLKLKEVNCFLETVTNKPLFKEAGIKKAEEYYADNNGSKGKFLHTIYYYNDGRVVRDYKKDGKHYRELTRKGSGNSVSKLTHKITQPLPIKIDYTLPDKLKNNKEVVRNAKAFAATLESEKANIMQTIQNLNIRIHDKNNKAEDYKVEIDNDKYNMYARLAMCMAENETVFGTNAGSGWGRKYKYKYSNSGVNPKLGQISMPTSPTSSKPVVINLNEVIKYYKGSSFSLGFTQIKFSDHIKTEDVKAVFDALGIKKEEDLMNSPANSAKATVALLAILDTRLKYNPALQNQIDACEGAIVEYNGFSIGKNGNAVKNYKTQPWVNHLSDEDKLCYGWNKPTALVNGNAEPAANMYTRNIHEMMTRCKIIEKNPGQRDNIIGQRYQKTSSMLNNGPLGGIKITSGYEKLPEEIIKILEDNTHHLSENSRKKLIDLLKNRKFAFRFGVTPAEVRSITDKDVELLCKYAQYDVKVATKEFMKEYLESKAVKVERKYVDAKSVMSISGKRTMPEEFYGVHKKYDTGVKTSQGTVMFDYDKDVWYIINSDNTRKPVDFTKLSANEYLALKAQRTALIRNKGGDCFQYWRKTLIESGVDVALSPSQAADVARCGKYKMGLGRRSKTLVEYDYKLAEGEKYKKKDDKYYLEAIRAKDTERWFKYNKDKFVEVKWVDIGNDIVRQITTSDLPNLPSGYAVVWYPGPEAKYKNQEGHACITSGNGLAYADEADNMAWNNFFNGKGEHGTFKVYKLADGWRYNPKTDRLEFTK